MGTQLILTVGTNPLPVWVAWYHLKDKLPKQPIKVRLVHTAGTQAEMERLQTNCQGADFLDPIQTSAGDPGTVREDSRGILRNLPEDINLIHVHYTSGTKVMGVETVSAVEAELEERQNIHLQTSYLDPRGASGPTIVSRGDPLVKDTRQGVDPDLARVAFLNGFTLGPFEHTYWDWGIRDHQTKDCPAPGTLDQNQLQKGSDAVAAGKRIPSTLLEYGAYAALENTLERISTRRSDRNNYKVFHSVYIRRDGTTDPNVRPFELDVVAVLGYQILVVSCTANADPDLIKRKGMEAILRARQLGGDEARAIVLCSAHPHDAQLIEDELKDEMGSGSEPLQVWGRRKDRWGGRGRWISLPDKFYQYLCNDLHWK